MPTTLVGQIVPVHTRDHHIIQTPRRNRLGHIARFIRVRRRRRTRRLHVAKPATASAGIAEDHDGGSGGASFAAGPALAEIGTAGLLADSVEVELAELLLNLDILLTAGDGLLHPLGLGEGFLLGANLNGVGEVGEGRGFEREAGPETLKGLGEFGGGGCGGGGGEESTNRGNGFEAGLHGSLLSLSLLCEREIEK